MYAMKFTLHIKTDKIPRYKKQSFLHLVTLFFSAGFFERGLNLDISFLFYYNQT